MHGVAEAMELNHEKQEEQHHKLVHGLQRVGGELWCGFGWRGGWGEWDVWQGGNVRWGKMGQDGWAVSPAGQNNGQGGWAKDVTDGTSCRLCAVQCKCSPTTYGYVWCRAILLLSAWIQDLAAEQRHELQLERQIAALSKAAAAAGVDVAAVLKLAAMETSRLGSLLMEPAAPAMADGTAKLAAGSSGGGLGSKAGGGSNGA